MYQVGCCVSLHPLDGAGHITTSFPYSCQWLLHYYLRSFFSFLFLQGASFNPHTATLLGVGGTIYSNNIFEFLKELGLVSKSCQTCFMYIVSTTLPNLSTPDAHFSSTVTNSHQELVSGQACNPHDPRRYFFGTGISSTHPRLQKVWPDHRPSYGKASAQYVASLAYLCAPTSWSFFSLLISHLPNSRHIASSLHQQANLHSKFHEM
jgi:hypothetical protein